MMECVHILYNEFESDLLEASVEKVGWYVPVERVINQKYMKW